MTKLSAPAPSPSIPRKNTGRYIDFVAKPKTATRSTSKAASTERPSPKIAVAPKPTTSPKSASAPKPSSASKSSKKPSPKGFRIDFVRRPTSAPRPEVKVRKTVQISIASAPEKKPKSPRTIDIIPKEPEPKKPKLVVDEPVVIDEPLEVDESTMDDVMTESPIIDDEPLMDDDELSLALAGFADGDESLGLTDNLSREASDLEDELNALDELDDISDDLEAEIADFVEEPKPIFENKKDAPDANRFSLGGRSPFLASVKVEKRPLSGAIPEEEIEPVKKETPLKNTYRAKIKQVLKSDDKAVVRRETTIVSTPETRSNGIALAFAIILTIILGALIGAVVYLVFFQQ